MTTNPTTLSPAAERAAALDAADPLARFRDRFVQHPDVVSYLDGNSLGRPVAATRERLSGLVETTWAGRLIRAWDETWMDEPTRLGDTIGRLAIGAAPGQTVVADSTSVLLYKLVRAALDARPDRREIVADTENFPTDRFILEGVAAETGRTIRWIEPDPAAGVSVDEVRATAGPDTALVLLSHVAFKSGYIADMAAITAVAHEAGALVLWDLCHSVGSIDVRLDQTGADLAVGCTYKYLNGGPGAPAFAYVAERLHDTIRQPIQGWLGTADPFAMTEAYAPSPGIRQLISGTPPIVGMQPMQDMLALIEEAGGERSGTTGIAAIRRKSLALTDFVIDYADEHLARFGVRVISPRDPAVRGSHVTLEHPDFRRLTAALWERGVIPDFRPPQGMRIGLSPLSTSFAEVALGLDVLAELLERDATTADG
ncbi:kynureninase [Leucobacter triazinivorans]|uniref:Kynureninase n=1 Tax=Leucobacter triazinivorans TaxID=1784719 RepID=A0A4P6KFT7_9MICO|nr:aminotransferase class V-fold PLP-dependent enzyme [Leucobacter triazinivorans]QBE48871.1 aminotransferase class V-fold PLP-dependent enzyme [Leucobacter triazinivorans]